MSHQVAFDWEAAGAARRVAPQRVTVAPVARQARASGRAVGRATRTMLAYRDALRRLGPATDAAVAAVLGWGVSSCCGRRGDWNALAPKDRPVVVAVDRVRVGPATQCRWRWVGGPEADAVVSSASEASR
ncbi:MAG: hypothetical protein AB7P99_10565 [Vicinamibacterales bacterium]